MNRPRTIFEQRTECPARGHDTYSAYQRLGCRCPQAREDHRLNNKRSREKRNPSRRIPAIGTQRRIHALMALGHNSTTIGWHANQMSGAEIQQIGRRRRWVTPETAARIAAAYETLSGTAGTSTTTRARAKATGYAPPLAWDDDTIDNPDAQPDLGGRGDTVVDEVAVEMAASGELPFGKLVTLEQVELYRRHGSTAGHGTLCSRWGVSTARLRKIAALAKDAA
jgi:hypothetical protein